MTVLQHFRRQLEYEFWANGEVLRVLAALPESDRPPVRLLAHIIAAQRLWLDRLQNQPAKLPVWPDLSLEQCAAEMRESVARWRSYLSTFTESELDEQCSYTNSKGEVWKNNVADILSHVVLHSGYHRGQIALEIRRGGNAPAYTDFIHAARQGLIE